MPDRRLLLAGSAAVVLAGGFAAWRWMAAPTAPVATAPTTPPAPAPAAPSAQPRPTTAGGLDERSLGRADAPVTAIEYFSLTCSHCGAFHRDTWPRVKRELVETGRVRMVFRDFPLDEISLRAHAA